jgi:hypothetical protein
LLGSAFVRATTGFDQGLVKFETEHFLPIYRALNEANVPFLIIGGQACALWSLGYQDRSPKLKQFFSYATRDLDFCATSKNDVTATAEALEVEPQFPRKRDASQEIALQCYRKHGVRIERAIPAHVLAENAAGRLENFVMKQLPRELMTLEKLREKMSRTPEIRQDSRRHDKARPIKRAVRPNAEAVFRFFID